MIKLMVMLVLVCSDSLAFAHSVAHFVPGKYSLEQGETKLCGEGNFYVSKNGDLLWLGPYYSFKTSNVIESNPAGPEDKGCVYTLKTEKKDDQIVTTDILKCGSVTRHTVTTKVRFNDRKIALDQTQVVSPKFQYNSGGVQHSCLWSRN